MNGNIHVRFGGGLLEKCPQGGELAGFLPDDTVQDFDELSRVVASAGVGARHTRQSEEAAAL